MRRVCFYVRQLWMALCGQTADIVVTDCVFTNCGPRMVSGDVLYRRCTFVDDNEMDRQSIALDDGGAS